MSLADYMTMLAQEDLLGHGFGIKELVKPRWKDFRGKFKLPPESPMDLRARMVPTLRLANILRAQWVAAGGHGLRIAAAYRPSGGARASLHKVNAALDLDILKQDYKLTREWYAVAVRLWCQVGYGDRRDAEYPMLPPGRSYKMGLGLYCSPKSRGGIRVHIDTGRKCRTWQHWKGKSIRPAVAFRIAESLGLEFPTRPLEKRVA